MPRIIAQPHPLKPSDRFYAEFPAGPSIAELLGQISDRLYVEVDGVPVPPEGWGYTRPAEGELVTAIALPHGPLKVPIFAAVAASVSSAAAAVGLGAAANLIGVAAGVIGAGALTVGASMGLSMAMNALIKPQQPTGNMSGANGFTSRYNALAGGNNQAAKYAPIPVLYGQLRITPPLAALYYTESRGNQQYLRVLLCLGYGPMQIGGYTVGPGYSKIGRYKDTAGNWAMNTSLPSDTIRIGQTAIEQFGNSAEWEIGAPGQITLYTNDVAEQSLSIDFPRTGSGTGWQNDGQATVRTTDDNAKTISLDVAFPALIALNARGDQGYVTVRWKIEYSPAGANTWTVVKNPWETIGRSKSPMRFHYQFDVPTAGRYDVRLTRLSTYTEAEDILQSGAIWTALRSIRTVSPWNADANKGGVPNVVLMALRVRATGQLNGQIDPVSVLAKSVLRTWNGTAFSWQPTASAAWAFAHALTGPQLQRPVADSRIDWDGLQAWAGEIAGKFEFHWYYTGDNTLVDRVREIARSALGEWSLREGLFSVVRDNQTTPLGLIGPRNSRNFVMDKSFPKIPNAVRVKYLDPSSGQEAERIVLDDGYSLDGKDAWGGASALPAAQTFESLETVGCTSSAEAFRHGRYMLAAARLRPETYTVEQDFEALRVTRGDCVRLAHDVLLVGIAHGRVTGATLNGGGQTVSVVVDEEVTMEAGKTYALRLRKRDGTVPLIPVATVAGTTRTLGFVTPTAGVQPDDLFTFGESGSESLLAKVTEISYRADLSATVKLIPAAPEILDADSGTIPAYDPVITIPIALRAPATPQITHLQAGGEALRTTEDGRWVGSLVVGWWMPFSAVSVGGFEVQFYGTGLDPVTVPVTAADATSAALANCPAGVPISVQVRALSSYGRPGPWSDVVTATVENASTVAEPPASLGLDTVITVRLDGTVDYNLKADWTAPTAGLVDHYEVEWKLSADPDSAYAGVAVSRASTEYLIPGVTPDSAYTVRVRTVTVIGTPSAWITGSDTVAIKNTPPNAPSGLSATGQQTGVLLTWSNPADLDISRTELWAAASSNRAAAALVTSLAVGPSAQSNYQHLLADLANRYYWVRSIDTSGNQSAWHPSSATGGIAAAMTGVEGTLIKAGTLGALGQSFNAGTSVSMSPNTKTQILAYTYTTSQPIGASITLLIMAGFACPMDCNAVWIEVVGVQEMTVYNKSGQPMDQRSFSTAVGIAATVPVSGQFTIKIHARQGSGTTPVAEDPYIIVQECRR